MGLLCGVDRQCESGDLTICVHIEAIGVLFGITGRFHVCICFGRISSQLFGFLIADCGGGYKAPIGDLGIGTAEIRLEGIIVQRVGNRLTQILVGEQSLRIIECQHGGSVCRGHIDQRHVGITGQHILICSCHTGGVGPDHVDIALLERQIHGILVAKKLIDDLFHIGLLGILFIHNECDGARFLIEGLKHIRAAGDPSFLIGDGVLALINMLGHHTEGRHVAQFTDVGRRQRQRNAHLIVGDSVAGVLGFCDFSLFVSLRLKVGASIGLIVLEGKEDVLGSNALAVGPRHAVLNGICPGSGILGSVGCQQRMVFALGVLIDQRQFGYTAGQHIKIVFAKGCRFNGSSRADCNTLDLGRRFICRVRLLTAGCHGKHHQHSQQQGYDFFHHWFFSFCREFLLSNT